MSTGSTDGEVDATAFAGDMVNITEKTESTIPENPADPNVPAQGSSSVRTSTPVPADNPVDANTSLTTWNLHYASRGLPGHFLPSYFLSSMFLLKEREFCFHYDTRTGKLPLVKQRNLSKMVKWSFSVS